MVSTAIRSPGPARGPAEVGGGPWFRAWFSIDPQPASISPTVNISIVFICSFLVDYGRKQSPSSIKNDSNAILARTNNARNEKISGRLQGQIRFAHAGLWC